MKSKFYFFYIINCILVFIFICTITYVNSRYFVIAYDDCWECFIKYYQSIYDNFIFKVYHGRYISNILVKLQCGIFDIHPITWIRTYGAILKSIFLFIVFMLLSSVAFLPQKNENYSYQKYLLLPFLICSIFIFYHLTVYWTPEDMLHTFFYGFIFPFIFFCLFWNKFIIIYTNNKILSNSDKIYFIIVAFLLGISTEFTIIVTFISLLILICFNYFKKDIFFKQFYLIFAVFYLTTPLYFFNRGFISSAIQKGTFNGFYNMLNNAIRAFPEFIADALIIFPKFFNNFIFPLIIIFLILLFSKDKYKYKTTLLITSLFISILSFYFLLIFAGRGPGGILFSCHFSTNVQIQIGLIYLLLLSINISTIHKHYKIFLYIVFILHLSLFQPKFLHTINHIRVIGINNYHSFFEQKISNERYVFEKILLFYVNKNQIPILPKDNYSFTDHISSYLASVYNIRNFDETTIVSVDKDEAYNLYLKNGGEPITSEELKLADFQKFKKMKNNVKN